MLNKVLTPNLYLQYFSVSFISLSFIWNIHSNIYSKYSMEVSDNWVYLFVLKQFTAVVILDFLLNSKFSIDKSWKTWPLVDSHVWMSEQNDLRPHVCCWWHFDWNVIWKCKVSNLKIMRNREITVLHVLNLG